MTSKDNVQQGYDSHADALNIKEADRALMKTWQKNMERIIIFAGLFSVFLTPFIIHNSRRLRENPTENTIALLNQLSQLLDQIHSQTVPASISQPPMAFKPKPSDLRINTCWVMSLFFTLSAAFWAILVQKSILDYYLQVSQPFGSPFERSGLARCQILFQESDNRLLHLLVRRIPILIYISLFLFFLGLGDYFFAIKF